MPSAKRSDAAPAYAALYIVPFLILLVIVSVLVGAGSFADLTADLIWISRVPRTLAALLCGASLAVAGVVVQQLVNNRFVEPAMTGSNEAAILGLVLISLLMPSAPIYLKMIVAAVAALLGSAVFVKMARHLSTADRLLVPLIGIIYSGIIGAAAMALAWTFDMLQYLGTWLSGDLSGILQGRYEILWFAGAAGLLTYLVADQLTIAGMGEKRALSLGLNFRFITAFGLLAVSITSAVVVVTVGVLPFLGLVVPNIISRIYGDNLKYSLPVIALSGGALVLLADIMGRVVRFPYEVPASTIIGIVGAAIFLWLLFERRGHAG